MSVSDQRRISWLHRCFAGTGAALILLLAASAASPALHHWLHEGPHDAHDDACAVVLFASGVTLAAAAILVAAPRLVYRAPTLAPAFELFLPAPRYLRQPERGPPTC